MHFAKLPSCLVFGVTGWSCSNLLAAGAEFGGVGLLVHTSISGNKVTANVHLMRTHNCKHCAQGGFGVCKRFKTL